MPTATIKWVTQKDDAVCPICKAIDGYEWIFDNEIPPDTLIHPQYGEVWNKHLGSLAHEHQSSKVALTSSCRCRFHIQISMKDLLEKLKQKRDEIKKETEGGAEVRV